MKIFLLLSSFLTHIYAAQAIEERGDHRLITLRTHSLQKPYLDQDYQSRWWDYGGTTVVDAANHYDRQHSTGWLWSRLPITATNYEIEFEFKIDGRGSGIFGDGLAMWLTTGRAQTGPVFGNKDHFEGLGIMVDTYKNGRTGVTFPYVSAMLGDGHITYDAHQDGKNTELAGCSARGIRAATIPTKGRLTYYKDDYLKLELQYKSENEWTECFDVKGVNLPNVVYLGFTAITGEVSDNHDIINVHSRNIFATGEKHSSPSGKSKYVKDRKSGGSWFGMIFKFLLFLGVLAGAFYGFKAYKKKQKRDYIGF